MSLDLFCGSILIKRMWQKRWFITFEAKMDQAIQLLDGSLGTFIGEVLLSCKNLEYPEISLREASPAEPILSAFQAKTPEYK
jgi:hypothetical protein